MGQKALGFGQGMAITKRVSDSFLREHCMFLLSASSSGVAICCRDWASHRLEGSDKGQELLLWLCVASSLGSHLLWSFLWSLFCFKARDVKELLPGLTSLLLNLLWAQGLQE